MARPKQPDRDSRRAAMPDPPNSLPPPPAPMYQFRGAQNETKHDRGSKPPWAFTYRSQPKTYERPLLTSRHEESEQLTFPGAKNAPDKFRNIEEMTNTDDSEMEESDVNGEDSDQPPSKRARLDDDGAPTTRPALKWSNPDPYTALPPPNDTTRKKTNVVKLIRKARNTLDTSQDSDDPATIGEGFISLDVNGDFFEADRKMTAPANAPTGPRNDRPVHRAAPVSAPAVPKSNGQPAHLASTSHGQKTGESVLGKRPRNEFDEGRKPRTRFGKQVSDGMIMGEWAGTEETDLAPWLNTVPDMGDIAGTALHKEIIDFYEWVRPRDYERAVRASVVSRLEDAMCRLHPGGQLQAFGSYAAGLYLPTGDLDLVFNEGHFRGQTLTNGYPLKKPLHFLRTIAGFLEKQQLIQAGSIQIINSAKVPIIKFVEKISHLRVDLSFNNDTGVTANDTFHRWRAQHPAMPILVSIVKQFLMVRGLNNVSTGGLGGFSTICLVTSLLQHMPFTGQPPDLGHCLVEFFNLYGNLFNVDEVAVRLDPPGFISKRNYTPFAYNHEKPGRLSIVDPNRPDNNISGGTSEIQLVLQCFSEAHASLLRRLAQYEDGSETVAGFLVELVGGKFTAYDEQRAVLYDLHFGRSMPPPTQLVAKVKMQTGAPVSPHDAKMKSKKKNKKKKKDQPHPTEKRKKIRQRKAMSIFVDEKRPVVRAEQPTSSNSQISKMLVNRWAALSLQERAPYKAKAREERALHTTA